MSTYKERIPPAPAGVEAAARLLALPARVAQTDGGRRLLVTAALGAMLGGAVTTLYDHADTPKPMAATPVAARTREVASATATEPPAGAGAAPARPGRRGQAARRPAAPADPAKAAATWFARKLGLDPKRTRALQVDQVDARTVRVLVLAERGSGRVTTALVEAKRSGSGWKVAQIR